MKSLNIHPRMVSFFWMILTLNLLISIGSQWSKEFESGLAWFLNLSFPLWAAVIGGFPFGLIFFFVPQDETDFVKKMWRSQVFGIMVMSFILFVLYLYQMILVGSFQ